MAQSVQITKMHPKYEAILDYLISNPEMKKGELAAEMGVSQSWLSVVINSDLFQMKLDERREELKSAIIGSVKDKMQGLADLALDRLLEQVEETKDPRVLLDTADKMLDRIGYARKQEGAGGATGGDGSTHNHLHVNVNDLDSARRFFGQAREVHDVDARRVPEARVSSPGEDSNGDALLEASVHSEEESEGREETGADIRGEG